MSNKIHKRINGSFAIYYGIGAMLVAAGCFVALIVWGYKVLTGEQEADWQTPFSFFIIGVVMGAIGYGLYRTGYEEMEK